MRRMVRTIMPPSAGWPLTPGKGGSLCRQALKKVSLFSGMLASSFCFCSEGSPLTLFSELSMLLFLPCRWEAPWNCLSETPPGAGSLKSGERENAELLLLDAGWNFMGPCAWDTVHDAVRTFLKSGPQFLIIWKKVLSRGWGRKA